MIKITKSYQTAALSSASPLEQIAFLMDKAAKHVLKAKEALLEGNYEERFFQSSKAVNIMHGLAGIVRNPSEETNDFVLHMTEFFDKTSYAMYNINMENDPKLCDSLVKALDDMAKTWRKAAQEHSHAQLPETPASHPLLETGSLII